MLMLECSKFYSLQLQAYHRHQPLMEVFLCLKHFRCLWQILLLQCVTVWGSRYIHLFQIFGLSFYLVLQQYFGHY